MKEKRIILLKKNQKKTKMTTLTNIDEKGRIFAFSDIVGQNIYYVNGFNKPNRCEINLYSQDINNGFGKNKLIKSFSYSGKEKFLRSAGFGKIGEKSGDVPSKDDNANKRKLGDSETKEQNNDSSIYCLVLAFTNGETEIYQISSNLECSKINSFTFINNSLTDEKNNKIFIIDGTAYFMLQDKKKQTNDASFNILAGFSLLNGAQSKAFKDIKVDDNSFIAGSNGINDLYSFNINETAMSIVNLQDNTEQIISVDFLLNEQNEKIIIKDVKKSCVHDSLYYFLFENDDAKIHVYNSQNNEFVSRLNNINYYSISSFEIFKIGNIEYLAVLKDSEDEEDDDENSLTTSVNFFKCIIRRNCKNVNTSFSLNILNIPKGLNVESFKIHSSSNEQFLNLKISNIQLKIYSNNITELLSSKTKQGSISIEISSSDIEENREQEVLKSNEQDGGLQNDKKPKTKDLMLSDKSNHEKKAKAKKSKKSAIFFKTNDDSINSLVLQFKALNSKVNFKNNYADENEIEVDQDEIGQDEEFMSFLFSNNYNNVLIKSILKNLSTEEIDNLLVQLIKSTKEDEAESLSYLKLSNWFKTIFIINGGHLVKNSSAKKLQLLKDFQMRIKNNNDNLVSLLNLQGKLTLLKSQYNLRNQTSNDSDLQGQPSGNDSDDDLSNIQGGNKMKTQTKLLNNISNDGVQVINEDEIIYDNGEIDENVNDEDDYEDEDSEEEEADDDENEEEVNQDDA